MSIRRKKLNQKCHCGADMYRVSMKNPYLDDFEDECDGDPRICRDAKRAASILSYRASIQARAEHAEESYT